MLCSRLVQCTTVPCPMSFACLLCTMTRLKTQGNKIKPCLLTHQTGRQQWAAPAATAPPPATALLQPQRPWQVQQGAAEPGSSTGGTPPPTAPGWRRGREGTRQLAAGGKAPAYSEQRKRVRLGLAASWEGKVRRQHAASNTATLALSRAVGVHPLAPPSPTPLHLPCSGRRRGCLGAAAARSQLGPAGAGGGREPGGAHLCPRQQGSALGPAAQRGRG